MKGKYNRLKTVFEEVSGEEKQMREKCSLTYQSGVVKEIKRYN